MNFSVINTGVTLLVLNPTVTKQLLPQNIEMVQIVGVSNKPQQVSIAKPIFSFCLGPLKDTHHFILCSSIFIHILSCDFLENYLAGICFSQKGEIILEFDSSNQVNQMTLQHLLFAPSLMALELILRTLTICPYWIHFHLHYGQNLQLILVESTVHILFRSKYIPQNLTQN